MHNHASVNLEEITKQYEGKCLPDLLSVHIKTLSREILPQVLRESFMEFEPDQHKLLDAFTDDYLHNWLEPHIASMDLGDLLTVTVRDMQDLCTQAEIHLDDNRLFDLFHIMVMKLALRSHNHSLNAELD